MKRAIAFLGLGFMMLAGCSDSGAAAVGVAEALTQERTYSYQGTPFTQFPGPGAPQPPAGVDAISATFSVDLPPNQTSPTFPLGDLYGGTPLSNYSFADGLTTVDSSDPAFTAVGFFGTDAAGVITDYFIFLLRVDGTPLGQVAGMWMNNGPHAEGHQVVGDSTNYCRQTAGGDCITFAGADALVAGTLTVEPLVEEVTIDIKPGSDPNAVNPSAGGYVAVAILTTSVSSGDALDFDATQVDPESVAFGPSGVAIARPAKVKDVDRDGDADLILHFKISDTGITCGDTEATLTGETFAGDAIQGTDSLITRCN